MERLTQTSDKGGVAFTFDLDVTCQPSEMKKILKIAEKLKEYEDLEEQGLLLRLPCKVGDTVYYISEGFIEPCSVETIFLVDYMDENGNCSNMAEIHYDREDCPYVSTDIYFTDIGKTVFLTQTEAEQKLKEMEGGNNGTMEQKHSTEM